MYLGKEKPIEKRWIKIVSCTVITLVEQLCCPAAVWLNAELEELSAEVKPGKLSISFIRQLNFFFLVYIVCDFVVEMMFSSALAEDKLLW